MDTVYGPLTVKLDKRRHSHSSKSRCDMKLMDFEGKKRLVHFSHVNKVHGSHVDFKRQPYRLVVGFEGQEPQPACGHVDDKMNNKYSVNC